MTELGLFVPENPVTAYATPVEAVDAVLHGDAGANLCPRFRLVNEDLPPELLGLGLVRAQVWARTHRVQYHTNIQAAACGHFIWQPNVWLDGATGRVLAADAAGHYYLQEHLCTLGEDRPEYKTYDLAGTYVCSTYPPATPIKDPELPGGNPGPFGPGVLPGFFPQPGGGGLGRGGLPITVNGVNLGDVGRFLQGLGGATDLAGVVQALVALVVQGGNIRGALDTIPPELARHLDPGFLSLGSAVAALVPGLSSRLTAALAAQGDKQGEVAKDVAAASVAAAVKGIPPLFQALTGASANTLKSLGDIYKGALDTLIGAILRLFRDDIEAHAPVTAGNVDKVAAAALRSALTAGSVAQLAGMGLELLHPLKSMGVQQAIGVLAEFAGFSEIAKPFFGATLRYGIGLPAEHRAAAHFRSVLPSPETVRELAAIGLVPLGKYHDRLVLQGYPDPFPAALTDILYTPLPARFLAQLLDGSESDRPWLGRQFRRLGFSPENIERAVRAAELKTTQPGRGRLAATLLGEYQHGRLGRPELSAGLADAGLSVTHRGYYLRVADLERRGYRMELVATEALNQYRNDLVGEATLRQLLAGLGYTADEITVRVVAADLRRGVKQVGDEVREIEAEIRALKAEGLRNATRQLRARFLDLATFLAVGQGMGYSRAYLQNTADLAYLQGTPTTTDAAPAIGLGALDETRTRLAELVSQEVAAKRMDRVSALVSLLQVGLPGDLVTVIVGLAEAIAGPVARDGEYGMPAGGQVGSAFGAIEAAVLAGLGGVGLPSDVVTEVLKRLGVDGGDRSALMRLIGDVRDLFRA